MSEGPPFKTTLLIMGILVASGIEYEFSQAPIMEYKDVKHSDR